MSIVAHLAELERRHRALEGADRLSAPTAAVTTGRDLPQRRGLGASWPTDQCRTCRFVLARLPRWRPTRLQPSIRSNWVIGIEGGGSGSDIRGDITQTVLGITGTAHAQTDWIASAPDRLGVGSLAVICQGRSGVGWRRVFCIHSFVQRAIGSERDPTGLDRRWRHRMGILEQWSAKAEYDYYDFGTRTITLSERLLVLPSTSRVNVWQRNLSRQVRDQLSILSPQRLALAGRASRQPHR
jgi:hypothetical protein